MKTWRKGLALLLVGMMMMSGLVALSAPAIADKVVKEDWLELDFDDTYMIDGLTGVYRESVYDAERGTGGWNLYRVGEGDGVLDWNSNGDSNYLGIDINILDNAATDLYVNITSAASGSFDFDDSGDTTSPNAYPIPGGWTAGGIGTYTFEWNFDILITDMIGYGPRTLITCSYSYLDTTDANPANWVRRIGNFDIYISLSSIFDEGNDDTTDVLPDLWKDEGYENDYLFEAGDKFVNTVLDIYNPSGDDVDDLWVTLTPPTGITLAGADATGKAKAWLPDGIGGGNTESTYFRSNIESNLAPGRHVGSAVISYTRDDSGLTVTEPATEVVWPVDFNFVDQEAGQGLQYSNEQCYANSVVIVEDTRQIDYVAPYAIPSIEQSTYTDRIVKLNVTIVNNGNHPLYNVEFELDPAGWNNFRNPRFFWEDIYAGPSYDTISDTVDVFAVGDEVTFTIEVIVANDIPIGEHRLPILYRGYYFDDGALENPTGFFEMNGGDDLVVLFSIYVTDSVIQCHVSDVTTNAGDKDNIVAESFAVTLVNDEGYNFIDIMVRANFTGTPWYMPVINMRNPLVWADNANAAMPLAAWDAHDDMTLYFNVDTDPTMTPDTYPFTLEVTAVIEETLEVVSVIVDYTQGAVVYYEGYGPEIQISAFVNTDIVPGQMFNMTMTIQNVGDETLRDVWIYVDSDDTEEYDWALEQTFKEQFDWSSVFEDWGAETGGQVTWNGEFPEDMFYTVEDLDVDNIREIVEINLYMDGVYSTPGARITMIKIIDLAPGAQFDATFDMYADKDMVNGKPYTIEAYIYGLDPYGNEYFDYLSVSVMSSLPGESYNAVELNWFDAGLKALALFLFFIIVLAILLFVYNMFKGEPYDDDEEDFDFEDEPFEPEAEAAPAEAPQQELVEP